MRLGVLAVAQGGPILVLAAMLGCLSVLGAGCAGAPGPTQAGAPASPATAAQAGAAQAEGGAAPRSPEPPERAPATAPADPQPASAPGAVSAPVQVAPIAAGDPLLGRAGVRAGDFALRAPGLLAVVAGPGRGGPTGEGGHLVALAAGDAAPADFGDASPVFDPDGVRGLAAPRFEVVESGGRQGVLRVTGHVLGDDDLRVRLEYRLAADATELEAHLRVENRAPGRHPDLRPGWFVRWGRLAPFVPETAGDWWAQRTEADWVGGTTAATALLFAWEAGRVFARHGSGWSTLGAAGRPLGPRGERSALARFRLGGEAGLGPLIRTELAARGAVAEEIHGTVVDAAGRPLPDATVHLLDPAGRALAADLSDAEGAFSLWARVGGARNLVVTAGLGRPTAPVSAPSDGRPVRLRGPAVGRVVVEVVDGDGARLPAQVALLDEAGVGGAEGAAPASPHAVFAPDGHARLLVRPGTWRVQAEAGPLRPAPVARVTVVEGETNTVRLRLAEMFAAEGWRALDAHLALPPGGAGEDRLRACAAAGVEAVVAPGEAAASGAGRAPAAASSGSGTAQVLPAARVAVGARALFAAWGDGGRVDHLQATPAAVLAELGARRRWRAVLRPHSPGLGYFARFAFDPRQEGLPAGGFALDFEALEVGGPDPIGPLDRLADDWLALRRRGAPVVALGGSAGDSAARCGAARTWVQHPEPLADERAWRAALQAAPTCVSTGPRTLLSWPSPDRLRLRVQAAPRHRPTVATVVGPDGVIARLPIPAGDEPLDFVRDVPVPRGVPWAVARTAAVAGATRTPGGGALEFEAARAPGWSLTGVARSPWAVAPRPAD